MIHPFAHMNSNYQAAQFRSGAADFAAQRREDFAEMLHELEESRRGGEAPAAKPVGLNGHSLPSTAAQVIVSPVSASGVVVTPQAAPPPTPTAEAEPPAPPAEVPASGTPHFADVPDSAKFPLGPYRQAPSELGGEWWYVSPFTGDEPWSAASLSAEQPPPSPPLPEGFTEVFGERPNSGSSAVRAQWKIDLEHFQGTGLPEGFTQEQADRAAEVFESWGLGAPVFYEGRYGWKARFPESGIPGFEANPHTAIETPHLVVAGYQVRQTQQGGLPAERHPFVPPVVFGESIEHA